MYTHKPVNGQKHNTKSMMLLVPIANEPSMDARHNLDMTGHHVLVMSRVMLHA